MRSILIGIIILIMILIFWSLRGPIAVVKGRKGGGRTENNKDPEKINRCIEMLGLKPGASQEEVNQAYKDLVNVWHPDRFVGNPRLQKKAEGKLKEINASYEHVKSFYHKK